MARVTASELIDLVFDAQSWVSWDEPASSLGFTPEYVVELEQAAERAQTDESVRTGEGTVDGHAVAALVGDFGFLAGSIGRTAASRLTTAIRRATAAGLPLVAAPASGGTRMQEGTLAFVRMIDIALALADHKAAGLPFLVYLRHPTTGGVMATWGSLGHITIAEPGALVGFLGPRVYEAIYQHPFPENVQTSENLHQRGIIDAVVAPHDVPSILSRALALLIPSGSSAVSRHSPPTHADPDTTLPRGVDAWESVQRSRDPRRPGVRTWLRLNADDVVPLSGTGQGETDPAVLLALASFGGLPVVLCAQDRAGQGDAHALGPEGLRVARRGYHLAAELGLPLVSVIDTPGAALSKEAEEGALAGEIARSLADLVTLPTPTLTVMLGPGTGGGALAMLPADRVVAAEHSWLTPLPPEGASAIMHRTTERAPDLARAQGVRSVDLAEGGVVDRIVAECPDAADEPEEFCQRLTDVVIAELQALLAQDDHERQALRRARYGG